MARYDNNVITVTTVAALLVTVSQENDGVLLTNTGSNPVFVGNDTVSATNGFKIAAGATQSIPSLGGITHDLWAVATGGTSTVSYIQPLAV
jgi:hypothetical protein